MRRRSSATVTAGFLAWLAAGVLTAGEPPAAGASAPPPNEAVRAAPSTVPAPAPLPAAESPDAFYLGRMKIGQQALADGRAAEASDNLRVASFGLLGDPAKLTECLVWLAVAQQRARRSADVDATLKRFQAVQALFPSYGEIALGPEVRSEFETLARRRSPGMVFERPREAARRSPSSAPVAAPPAPVAAPAPEPPAPAPGPALAASLRPEPAVVPLAADVSPRPIAVAASPPAAVSPPAARPTAAGTVSRAAERGTSETVFDREFRTRGAVVFGIRPDQARLFVDGRYVGISADWGSAGGRPFPLSGGEHTVRAVLPGYRELRLRIVADPTASADAIATAELVRGERRSFRRIPRPDYVTGGRVAFAPEMRGVEVAVDGEATGPADRFPASAPMRLSGPAVHDVVLSKTGRPARTIRILASPTAGDGLVMVRTAL